MIIDLLGDTAEQKYLALNSQRSINWYLVPSTQAEMSKAQKSMFPTPGLSLFTQVGGRYHRGAFVARSVGLSDRCFFVVDQTLYELGLDTSITNRGSISGIPFGSDGIRFAVNGNNHMFVGHAMAGYDFDLITNTLVQITDPDFPGAETAAYMDGYLIVSKNGRVYFNEVLNDFTSWSGTDVLTPTFKADGVVAVGVLKEELATLGGETIEFYLNDGTSPFSRRSGSTSLQGLAARNTLAVFNDGYIFVGKSDRGQYAVYTLGYDYSINQLSDLSKTWFINDIKDSVENMSAYITNTKDGHIWYHLHIPGKDTTLVYDVMTKQWFERQSRKPFRGSDGSYLYGPFRGKYYVNFNGLNLFFDAYTGKIFKEDFTVLTEDGETILRERVSKTFEQERRLISTSDLQIDYNAGEAATAIGQGIEPILMIRVSKDGGKIFSPAREIKLGELGKYIQRAKINRLGSGRAWVLKLILSDPVDLMIMNAVATGSVNGTQNG